MELLEYLEKLEILENENKWDEVLSISEEAIDNYTYSLSLKTYKIKALINKGELTRAKDICFELIKSNPGSSVIHSLLAQVFEELGETKKAIDEYNKIIFLNPGDINALQELERLKKGEGHTEQASKDKKEVIGEKIDNEGSNVDMGVGFASSEKDSSSFTDEKEEENPDVNNSLEFDSIDNSPEEVKKEIVFEEQSENDNLVKQADNKVDIEQKQENDFPEEETDFSEVKQNIEDEEKEESEIKESFEEDNQENKEPFVTYSMAELMEKQEKYKDAQKIYKKIFKFSNESKAQIGYRRAGLKRFLIKLENVLTRKGADE